MKVTTHLQVKPKMEQEGLSQKDKDICHQAAFVLFPNPLSSLQNRAAFLSP